MYFISENNEHSYQQCDKENQESNANKGQKLAVRDTLQNLRKFQSYQNENKSAEYKNGGV